MMVRNTVCKIVRGSDSFGWKLTAFLTDGSDQCFGHGMTERGSKCMLTRRAKQFGLKVNGNIAE